MSETGPDPRVGKIEKLIEANQKKINRIRTEFGITLDGASALFKRLNLLAQAVDAEVPDNANPNLCLETLIDHLLGPLGDGTGASDDRLDFELDWHKEVAESLEEAHNQGVRAKLAVPQNGKKLHLP